MDEIHFGLRHRWPRNSPHEGNPMSNEEGISETNTVISKKYTLPRSIWLRFNLQDTERRYAEQLSKKNFKRIKPTAIFGTILMISLQIVWPKAGLVLFYRTTLCVTLLILLSVPVAYLESSIIFAQTYFLLGIQGCFDRGRW